MTYCVLYKKRTNDKGVELNLFLRVFDYLLQTQESMQAVLLLCTPSSINLLLETPSSVNRFQTVSPARECRLSNCQPF